MVWDGSSDPRGGPGRVKGPFHRSGMVLRLSKSFETGRGTLREVWDGSGILGEDRDGLEYPHTGLGQVGGPL